MPFFIILKALPNNLIKNCVSYVYFRTLEKSWTYGAIAVGFASHCLKNWHENFLANHKA